MFYLSSINDEGREVKIPKKKPKAQTEMICDILKVSIRNKTIDIKYVINSFPQYPSI